MSKPYKMIETRKYTETVYYNTWGEEVYRERNDNDWLYDVSGKTTLSEQEIEDFIGEEN